MIPGLTFAALIAACVAWLLLAGWLVDRPEQARVYPPWTHTLAAGKHRAPRRQPAEDLPRPGPDATAREVTGVGMPGGSAPIAAGPGHPVIQAVPVQGTWLPLSAGPPWEPVACQPVIPVRDRPALLRPWIAQALGAPSVDAAMFQIFGPPALAITP